MKTVKRTKAVVVLFHHDPQQLENTVSARLVFANIGVLQKFVAGVGHQTETYMIPFDERPKLQEPPRFAEQNTTNISKGFLVTNSCAN